MNGMLNLSNLFLTTHLFKNIPHSLLSLPKTVKYREIISKIVPLVSSGIAGPNGALHLRRL